MDDTTFNEFDSLHFTSTSTPMTSASQPSQKKRQLIKEINRNLSFASPAMKKMTKGPNQTCETMPDLFDYDNKGKRDRYSFEKNEEEDRKDIRPMVILSSDDDGDDEEESHSNSQLSTNSDDSSAKENKHQKKKLLLSSDMGSGSSRSSLEGNEEDDGQTIEETSSEISQGKAEDGLGKLGNNLRLYSSESESSRSSLDGNDEKEDEHSIKETSSEISKAKAEDVIEIVEDSGSIGGIKTDEKVDESLVIIEEEEPEKSIVHVQEPPIRKPDEGPAMVRQPIYRTISVQQPVGRLFGGKMTDERFQRIQGVSNDIISAMHESLETLPDNVSTEAPKGLRIDLMPHQKTGLAWLLWREEQMPPGGILADDMGLGKTLAMIALILYKKNKRRENPEEMTKEDKKLRRRYIYDQNLIDSNTTLVVAPASLIYQWEKEVRDRVKDDRLKIHVFHGPKSKRDIAAHRIAKYDIVITTYEMLVSELKNQNNLIGEESSDEEERAGPSKGKPKKPKGKMPRSANSVLAKIAWERIILDEAHEIRNKNSLKARCCSSLEAVHRWCLTGTPIHNKLWDLFSLIRFLRLAPFSEEKMWKDFIMTNSATSAKRLNIIIKSILLRRTKNQMCTMTNRPIVDLQPKKYELVNLELQPLEKHCYSIMFEASKQKVRDLLNDGAFGGQIRRPKPGEKVKNPFIGASSRMDADNNFKAFSSILTLLLRLRQACVHFSLIRNAIDIDAFKQDEGDEIDGDAQEFVEKMLEMSMAQMSLEEDEIEAQLGGENGKGMEELNKIFSREHMSTKIVALMKHLDHVIELGDKCVIVSQWTSMLSLVEYHLKQKSVSYTSITGEVKTDERQSRVDNFNRVGMGPKVMLLSLTAGGVGLNLIGGNHLFLIDLHWNPALEQQASDRIYRLGQKKNVFIHKFICAETIEQRVLQLQEKKMTLATSVLEGAAKKLKLTRDDVMYLFELDKRPNQVPKPTQSQPVKPPSIFVPASSLH